MIALLTESGSASIVLGDGYSAAVAEQDRSGIGGGHYPRRITCWVPVVAVTRWAAAMLITEIVDAQVGSPLSRC